MTNRFSYFRPGDWLVVALGVALTGYSVALSWLRAPADELIMRVNGAIVARAALDENARFALPGALGTTVVAIENRRARIVSDPGARQICVQNGWLTRAGDVALCLPNRTSIELAGKTRLYDSLNY